jgi:hypothetical protein
LALEINSKNQQSHVNLGLVLMAQRKWELALKQFQFVIFSHFSLGWKEEAALYFHLVLSFGVLKKVLNLVENEITAMESQKDRNRAMALSWGREENRHVHISLPAMIAWEGCALCHFMKVYQIVLVLLLFYFVRLDHGKSSLIRVK